MSYGGGGNYNNNPAMYGGGGSTGANYYDPQATFNDTQYKGSSKYGNEDFNQAINHAEQYGDADESNKSIFSHAIDFIGKNKDRFSSKEDDDDDLDDNQAVKAHQSLYEGGSGSDETFDERSLGAGAAMQALKMFTSSSEGKSGSGGHDQNKFIGIAMAQAGKLWDEKNKGGKVKTDKQSAVNSAAKMALKMYMKNQGSSGGMGGGMGGTGGPGGLSSLASKFLSR